METALEKCPGRAMLLEATRVPNTLPATRFHTRAGSRKDETMMQGPWIAEIFGWLATAASVTSFVPQAWKIIKTRQTKDISVGMYTLTVSGFLLWTIYGVLIGAWPLVVTNAICAGLSAFILMMTLLPRRDREAVADALDPET